MGDGRDEGSSVMGDGGQGAAALTPDVDRIHVLIFESWQLGGSYAGDLLYTPGPHPSLTIARGSKYHLTFYRGSIWAQGSEETAKAEPRLESKPLPSPPTSYYLPQISSPVCRVSYGTWTKSMIVEVERRR